MLLIGAGLVHALLILFEIPPALWGSGYLQAALLSALIASLALLGQVASATGDMRNAARQLFAQPPGRRYLALGLGTHIFSLFLNIGSVAMIVPLVAARREVLHATGELRGALLAIVRGFGGSPMWGPLSLGVVVTVSLVPGISFLTLLPGGLALAATYMLGGYWLERRRSARSKPALSPEAVPSLAPEEGPLPGWMPLARVVLLVILIAFSAVAVESLTRFDFGQAVLLVAIAAALCWAVVGAIQRRQPVARATASAVGGAFGQLESEIVIISVSGFLSVALPLLIGDSLAGGLGTDASPLLTATLLALTPWGLVLPGLLGINPIISGSLLAALLPPMLAPWLYLPLSLAILCGWGATAGGTPFTANMLIASRLAAVPGSTLALRWNGPLTVIFVSSFGLLTFAYVLLFWR